MGFWRVSAILAIPVPAWDRWLGWETHHMWSGAHKVREREAQPTRALMHSSFAGAAGLMVTVMTAGSALAQMPSGPGLMRYDMMVAEARTGQALRLSGNVAVYGGGMLMRHCAQPAPYAPRVCQLTVDGQPSAPFLMPPTLPPGTVPYPGVSGWPGAGGGAPFADPATGAMESLFEPPPAVPGWTMRASGQGQWMGMAAQGSFSYWQPRW